MSRLKKGSHKHEARHRTLDVGEIKLSPDVLPWEVELLRPSFVAIVKTREVRDAT